MELGLAGKVALISAASSGLGRAVALALGREGARVALCSRDTSAIEDVASTIRDRGGVAMAFTADVTCTEDLGAFVTAAIERFGGIHTLIVNAGGPQAGPFERFADADWQAAFELTLMSAVRLIRLVLPSMRERGGGTIVCMSSSSIKQPISNLLLSNVMRAGVAGLAKTLADELAGDHIRINTVVPGRIATPRIAQLDLINAERAGIELAEIEGRETARIPMHRYGTPDEFADAVVFLASERAGYITGATLQVDGGLIRSLV